MFRIDDTTQPYEAKHGLTLIADPLTGIQRS